VYEYIEAAQMVKQLYPEVRFLLVGGTDDNPGSVPDAYLRSMVSKGILEWPGKVDNVQDYLRESSVFVLPSYYREGVPRSTQEAMALGRPIITTNVAGCRETVEDGFNGFLVHLKTQCPCRGYDSANRESKSYCRDGCEQQKVGRRALRHKEN